MNETHPLYHLNSLTDEQWDRQLLSQEKIETARIQSAKEVELEKLRNERETARERRKLTKGILGGLACFLLALTFMAGAIYAIDQDGKDDQQKAVVCIQSGGVWEESKSSRTGDSCDRP